MNIKTFLLLVAGLASLSVLSSPARAVTAGAFEFVSGDVRVRNASGVERVARRGERLEIGEVVISGAQSNAQLRMVDDAFIAVRPDTELNITDYSFSGRGSGSGGGSDNAVLRLVKGTMRAFTGAISLARRDRFQMMTPTATVGIRGSGNVLHFSPAVGTLNHTIEGSHAVTSVNAQGLAIGTIITNPGQTVQVFANQPPVRVPTPLFLVQAASSRPAPAAQGQGQQNRGQGGGSSGSSDSGSSGGGSSSSSGSGGTSSGSPGSTGSSTQGAHLTSGADLVVTPSISSVMTTPVATTIAPPVTTTTLTGNTTSGSTLNTSTATLTTSSGTTTAIAAAVTQPIIDPGFMVAVNFYTYPSPLGRPFGTNDVYRTESFGSMDGSVAFSGPNGNFSSSTRGATNARSLSVGGDTSGASTVTTLGNGISFGRYASQTVADAFAGTGTKLTVTEPNNNNAATTQNVIGTLQWIEGPGVLPIHMPGTLTGTAVFGSPTPSAPTDQNNVAGLASNVTATLLYNFDKQAVNTSIAVTMPPDTIAGGTQNRVWAASGTNLAFDDGGGFHANSGSSGSFMHNNLTVTLNGGSGVGNISGDFTGSNINGAILSYALGASDILNYNINLCGGYCHEHVNGVVGFGSVAFTAAPVATAPYYVMLSAQGQQGGFDSSSGANISLGSAAAAAQLRERAVVPTGIMVEDANRVKFDTRGAVTQYDATVSVSSGSCTTQCNNNDTPARLSIIAAGTGAFTGANGALVPAMPAITSAAATVLDFGSDPTTGISWGRYSNNYIAVVDRVTGNTINANGTFGPVNHYLLSPQQSGPTVLPATGSATYAFAGGTNPTDSTGAIGTLNSATLSANFSAQTVTTSVNATVGGRNWTAITPVAVPILAGIGFEAAKSMSASSSSVDTLAVTCAGSGCSTTSLAGRVSGVFMGTTGQGAGVAYSLNSGGSSGVTVGGVAAFKR